MGSSVRTALSGLGALAACLAMYSLKWEHLLLGVALLGVAWAAFTWWRNSRVENSGMYLDDEPLSFGPRDRHRPNNVYTFPGQISRVSDA